MNKKTMMALLMTGSVMCGTVFAQEAAAPAEAAAQEAPSAAEQNPNSGTSVKVTLTDSVETQMGQIVKATKLKKAARKGLAAFSVQSASIACKPSDPKYVTNRQLAYERAMLTAKNDIARTFSAQIATEASQSIAQGKDALKSEDKVMGMIRAEAIKQLTEKGVDMNDAAAVKAALPSVMNSTSFKKSTEVAAAAYLVGVQAFRTVTDKDNVGVIAVYSDKTRQIANAMFSDQTLPKGMQGEDLDEYVDGIEPEVLVNTFGIRSFMDDEGQCCLLAFVQEAVRSKSGSEQTLAERKARIQAESMFREFAGMSVTVGAAMSKSQSIAELSDNLGELSSVDEKFAENCAAKGAKMAISGINKIDGKTLQLPSGHLVYCAIYSWTPSASAMAQDAAAKSNESKALAEGKKAQPQAKAAAPVKKAAPAKKKYSDDATTGNGAGGGFY